MEFQIKHTALHAYRITIRLYNSVMKRHDNKQKLNLTKPAMIDVIHI